ncbi:hypothetical protein [Actinoplanes awajinensis]|uniref:Histidine kinase n=1 Tax=Actinoplanes awajinensis subsp. mycoplanecinus TaxID=135947 RepID=A0A0X3V1W8_9ACTN|nr:hypothetical protein [Actinoplanes awajinensis]KUL38785.1 hypothetical protein ADL15_10870 [Actinoplanes awajinensis subsp. mycoplanecinus]
MTSWSYLVIREVIAGVSGVTVAAFATAALCPDGEPAPRALVMAVMCGLLTTVLSDWRAIGVVVAACVFVYGFVLTASVPAAQHPWEFTPIFVVAAILGVGSRLLRAADHHPPAP